MKALDLIALKFLLLRNTAMTMMLPRIVHEATMLNPTVNAV